MPNVDGVFLLVCKPAKLCEYCGVVCSGVVLQVLFHPKQLMLVTSGDDSDVRVWDLVSKSCVAVLKVLLTAVPHQHAHPAVVIC